MAIASPSKACTVEIAAFDEFSRLLGDDRMTSSYDHVVFDTAPTGHTLRLLALPAAWAGFLESNVGGTSCLGPLAGLKAQQALYQSSRQALMDGTRTTLILVTRAEKSALKEAERTRHELAQLGVTRQELTINARFRASDANDATAHALQLRQESALEEMPAGLRALNRTEIAQLPVNLVGVEALRALLDGAAPLPAVAPPVKHASAVAQLSGLVDAFEGRGRGVIMTMGKGGVGKTTIAVAIATELARRGHEVRLTTTDPAAHVHDAVGSPIKGLDVGRTDPAAETRAYAREVMGTAGAALDAAGRALLEEDLRSPCTEEIAVFRAFARTVDEGSRGFVVIDTAPTGHTLLLLDAAEAYHRELLRSMSNTPESVRRLLPRLRDGEYTSIVLVTLAEPTPVHEAQQLQADLLRAGIAPFAWVINQSLVPLPIADPLLSQRRTSELRSIAEVQRIAGRAALVPWSTSPLKCAMDTPVDNERTLGGAFP